MAITLEAGVSLGAMPIYRFGTEEQKRQWLPRSDLGPDAGGVRPHRARAAASDAGATRTTATLDGDRVGHQRHQGVHHQLGHRHHRAWSP
ncbi:MAG: acyl-CoA dehydrogenase family protein [Candidatus Nanopelagicales bacterium]